MEILLMLWKLKWACDWESRIHTSFWISMWWDVTGCGAWMISSTSSKRYHRKSSLRGQKNPLAPTRCIHFTRAVSSSYLITHHFPIRFPLSQSITSVGTFWAVLLKVKCCVLKHWHLSCFCVEHMQLTS